MSTVTGIIKRVNPKQTNGDYTNQTMVVTLEADTQYPQDVQFELGKKPMEISDSFRSGDVVEIGYNIRGRDYTNRQGELANYTSLQAWSVKKQVANKEEPVVDSGGAASNDESDLPF